MPDHVLGPLGDTPLPPLASAADVRARGEQRHVRLRMAMSAAALGLAALTGGIGYAVVDAGGPQADSLRQEPLAGAPPSAPPATPTVEPTADPPARSAAAVRPWWLPDAFLPPEAAAEAEWPGWVTQDPYTPDMSPLADPCGEDDEPLASQIRDTGEQSMSSRREAGGSSLVQEVHRYDDPRAAAAAFDEYDRRFVRCAEVPDPNNPPGTTLRSEVVVKEVAADSARLVVRRIPCSAGSCTEHFSTYVLVARAGDAVTVAGYTIAEDGDPSVQAQALAVALERHLRDTVVG